MWKTAKLGDVAKLYQPKTITKKEMSDDGEYPVYGANGIIGRYNCYNHEDSQLVIGCRGSCGEVNVTQEKCWICLLYTSPSPRDRTRSRMPSSA